MNDNKKDFIEDSGLPEDAKKQVRQALSLDDSIEDTQVPASYIPVHLHTQGKFSTPKLLHFKDYNTPQLNDLSIMTEDNALENIIRVLGENCYEDFDIGQCTQEELVEILGTILANFWRNKVKIPGYVSVKWM